MFRPACFGGLDNLIGLLGGGAGLESLFSTFVTVRVCVESMLVLDPACLFWDRKKYFSFLEKGYEPFQGRSMSVTIQFPVKDYKRLCAILDQHTLTLRRQRLVREKKSGKSPDARVPDQVLFGIVEANGQDGTPGELRAERARQLAEVEQKTKAMRLEILGSTGSDEEN